MQTAKLNRGGIAIDLEQGAVEMDAFNGAGRVVAFSIDTWS